MASNLSHLRLFGPAPKRSRPAKPYDSMTKAEMWRRIVDLETRIARTRTLAANCARDAHNAHDYKTRDLVRDVTRPCDLSMPLDKVVP